MEWIFDYIWGWYGIAGVALVICAVLAFLFPQFRLWIAAVAAGIFGVMAVYNKGQRDRAKLEQKRKDEAVAKAQADYDKIERRPDKPSDVEKRLRRGDF